MTQSRFRGGLVSSGPDAHKPTPMQLILNGERRETLARGIAELIAELGLDPRKLAVERNLEIVPRSAYAATSLQDGDRIEIVAFVGGG